MKIPKHTSLSLAGNVAEYEYSNKQRSNFYDKPDISPYSALSQTGKGQVGGGFWSDVLSGAAGGLGAIAGSIGGPIGSGALGAATAYGAKKLFDQAGLGMKMDNMNIQVPSYIQSGYGYQYKSPENIGLWGTKNSLGPVSMNAPLVL